MSDDDGTTAFGSLVTEDTPPIRITSFVPRQFLGGEVSPDSSTLVIPGMAVPDVPTNFLKGHGTYVKDGVLYASVVGTAHRVNKLIYVRPLKSRYVGDAGDVIIGRIDEVGQDRWHVDIGSGRRAQLLLTAINLPGGEQRRRTAEDAADMRQYYKEGEIIITEGQAVHADEGIRLHTRSSKYGRLHNGLLVRVHPSLVRRQPNHVKVLSLLSEDNIEGGMEEIWHEVQVALGMNGFVWVSPPIARSRFDSLNFSDTEAEAYETVRADLRRSITRARNCISLAHKNFVQLTMECIEFLHNTSVRWRIRTAEVQDISNETSQLLIVEWLRGGGTKPAGNAT